MLCKKSLLLLFEFICHYVSGLTAAHAGARNRRNASLQKAESDKNDRLDAGFIPFEKKSFWGLKKVLFSKDDGG